MEKLNGNDGGYSKGITSPVAKRTAGKLAKAETRVVTNDRVPRPPRRSEPEGFDPSSILHSFRRRWPIALVLGLLLSPALAIAAWLFLVPKHAAVAYLKVDSVDTPLAFATADRELGGRGSFDLYKNTQIQLILTPLVLNKALRSPAVKELEAVVSQPDALGWLSETMKIDFPNKGEVMTIGIETSDPSSSEAIVNAVVASYLDEADTQSDRQDRIANLEKVFKTTEDKVKERRARIVALADDHGTSDSQSLSVAQQMAVTRYSQVQSELARISFDLMRAEGELNAFKQLDLKFKQEQEQSKIAFASSGVEVGDSANLPEITLAAFEVERLLSRDRLYQEIYSEARMVRGQIEKYLLQYGEGMVASKRERLGRLEKELESRSEDLQKLAIAEKQQRILEGGAKTIDPSLSAEEQEAIRSQQKRLADAEARAGAIAAREIKVGILKEQRQRMVEDLATLEDETKKLGKFAVDVEMMRAEMTSLDEVLARLASEIERTKIEKESGSRVSLISPATKIANTDNKKRIMATAGLGMLGFMLPFIGLIGLDLRNKLVSDTISVKRQTGITVLGSVPHERRTNDSLKNVELIDGKHGNSVNAIVAMMVNMAKFEGSSVMMVTSAVAGEGKSTLARNLWRGLASADYRVLLLDFDLRRPSQHKYLDSEMGLGISDVLAGEAGWEDALRQHSDHGFYMTAGSRRYVKIAAAAHSILPNFFNTLRENFDFVIVDTPPILPVVDARLIGEHVDAAVLSVMKDRSRVPQLVAATEVLKAHGTQLMGVVVNGCSEKNSHYDYYQTT